MRRWWMPLALALLAVPAPAGVPEVDAPFRWDRGLTLEADSTCGDSLLGVDETCDDGNAVEGDGCSATCRIEPGWTCTAPVPPVFFSNAVGDGSFEEGTPNPFWAESGPVWMPICSFLTCALPAAQGGDWYAWFGGIAAEHTQSVGQFVTIAPTATTLDFEFWVEDCDSQDDVVDVTLDGNVVFTTDPCALSGAYLPRSVDLSTAPGGPYNDGGSHLLRFEGRFFATNGTNSNMFLDLVEILEPLDPPVPPVPSGCSRVGEVCYFEEFEDGLAGWTAFSVGEFFLPWGTTDDGACGSGNIPPGNYTGGAGEGACIDTDAYGPGLIHSFLCSPQLDLTRSDMPSLKFLYNYQIFNTSPEDLFQVLVGTVPPSPSTIGDYDPLFETRSSQGFRFGPGATETLPLDAYQGEDEVWVCYRYRAYWDLYAQVDEVEVVGRVCRDLHLTVGGRCPGTATVEVFGATPGGLVAVIRGSGPGSTTIPSGPCAGTTLDLASPQLVTVVPADQAGRIDVSRSIAGAACGRHVQILDVNTCATSRATLVP